MIFLTTGLPGAGKTLYTIDYVSKLAKESNRQVFYNGINDLKIPEWILLENPAKWMDVPDGSIILIDECQNLFRTRSLGSKVPDYVSALETHRHHGLDIFLITQHPLLIDSAVRRLAGRHWHSIRFFGLQKSNIYEFQSVQDRPENHSVKKDAIRKTFKYPKKVYGLYKSAEVHTVKTNLPARLLIFIIGPIVIVYCAWSFYSYLKKPETSKPGANTLSSGNQSLLQKPGSTNPIPNVSNQSPEEYIAQFKPRISGLPHTAPVYDSVTQVQSAPIPVGCVASKAKCSCYTFQSTVITMPDDICRAFVKNGFFDSTKPRYAKSDSATPPSTSVAQIASNEALPESSFNSQPLVEPLQ